MLRFCWGCWLVGCFVSDYQCLVLNTDSFSVSLCLPREVGLHMPSSLKASELLQRSSVLSIAVAPFFSELYSSVAYGTIPLKPLSLQKSLWVGTLPSAPTSPHLSMGVWPVVFALARPPALSRLHCCVLLGQGQSMLMVSFIFQKWLFYLGQWLQPVLVSW